MRARGYLTTGLAIGSVVGALGSPLVYRTVPLFHATPVVATSLPPSELLLPSPTRVEPAPDRSAEHQLTRPPTSAADTADASRRDVPSISTPADRPTTTAGSATPEPADPDGPSTSGPALSSPTTARPTTPATTTPASTSTSISVLPGAPTVCRMLSAANEAKLRAEPLRALLDVATETRYRVVVTLVAAQSTRPAQENAHRLDGLAALVGVPPTAFSATDDGRFGATMTSAQLCQVVYLRSVTDVEVTTLDVQEPPGPKSAAAS